MVENVYAPFLFHEREGINVRKVIFLSCVLIPCLLLLSCNAENSHKAYPQENDKPTSSNQVEISSANDVVWSNNVKSVVIDKTLPFPESWTEIAIVKTPAAEDEHMILFQLYEKIAYEANGTGLLFAISAESRENFTELQTHFLETEGIDVYSSCFGQANYVLGEDAENVYILALPTDVQYLLDEFSTDSTYNPDSEVNYTLLQSKSQAVIEKFLETNGITANKLCPASDLYSVDAE